MHGRSQKSTFLFAFRSKESSRVWQIQQELALVSNGNIQWSSIPQYPMWHTVPGDPYMHFRDAFFILKTYQKSNRSILLKFIVSTTDIEYDNSVA
jgi:hypothetical protein